MLINFSYDYARQDTRLFLVFIKLAGALGLQFVEFKPLAVQFALVGSRPGD
jgi:hypothetical protein